MKFTNIARILHDPDTVKSLPASSVKCSMVTYKLTPPTSTKFFNFNKFVSNLDLDLFLTNSDSLPYKWNDSLFADRHHKHIVTSDLRMIRKNACKNFLLKDLNIERLGL